MIDIFINKTTLIDLEILIKIIVHYGF